MLYSAVIDKQGKITTEVVERQEGEQCSVLRQFVGNVGEIIDDEQTGPECDEVHEIETL